MHDYQDKPLTGALNQRIGQLRPATPEEVERAEAEHRLRATAHRLFDTIMAGGDTLDMLELNQAIRPIALRSLARE